MGGAPAQGQDGFGAWGNMNDATAQMGVQFGKSAVAAGQDYVEKNVSYLVQDPVQPADCIVHALSPCATHQDLFSGHQLLCPAQTPPDPLSVET
jgi:hypothetical protein